MMKNQKHNVMGMVYMAVLVLWAWLFHFLTYGLGVRAGSDFSLWVKIFGLVGIGLFTVSVFPFSVWWWRRLDEASREAHKSAWFWGGLGGIFTGTMLAQFLSLNVPGLWETVADAVGMATNNGYKGFMYGQVFALLTGSAGYGIAWAFWWWRRR